jgi:hypothetical protein
MRRLTVIWIFAIVSCCPRLAMQPPVPEMSTLVPEMGTPIEPEPKYNRKDWGRWIDADKDCQDTRQEVLIAESIEPVTLDEKGCKVITGKWLCSFTGDLITDPRKLDIDHMVPLKEAHLSGGHIWEKAYKKAYANDLDDPQHLIAVSLSANRSKGSREPSDWLPPWEAYRCEYLRDWVTVKKAWELEIDYAEALSLVDLMAKYCRR